MAIQKPKVYQRRAGATRSSTLEALAKKHPDIIESISYEGEDGYWLYMYKGWYAPSCETGTIHEYTVKDCLEQFKQRYYDLKRWEEENE